MQKKIVNCLGNDQISAIISENSKLKEAVLKLRDINVRDKRELQEQAHHVQIELQRVQATNAKLMALESLPEQLANARHSIAILKEQLEAAQAQDVIINRLTEKNLQMEEQVTTLQETIQELNELKQVSAELEAYNMEEIKTIKHEIAQKDAQISNLESTIQQLNKKQKLLDQDNEKYRSKLNAVSNSMNALEKQNQDKEKKTMEVNSKSQEMASVAKNMEKDMLKLEFEWYESLLSYVQV